MNRLVKAEWYRVKNSSKLMLWLILISIITVLFPMINLVADYDKIDAMEFLSMYEMSSSTSTCLFMGVMTASMVAMNYFHKTSYYEVMQGNNIHHIILSKVIVNGILSFVMLVIGFFAGFVFFAITKGIGETHYSVDECKDEGIKNYYAALNQWGFRAFLFVLLIINMLLISILFVVAVRRTIGIALVFIFIEVENVLEISLSLILKGVMDSDMRDKVLSVFYFHRLNKLTDSSIFIDGFTVVSIVAMMIVDVAVLYFVAYNGYKKQKFK